MRNKKIPFVYAVWREGKYYVAQCLNIDLSSFGTTKNTAIKNLEEAIALYLEDHPAKIQKIDSPSIVQTDFQYA